jgi:hypothetical protein
MMAGSVKSALNTPLPLRSSLRINANNKPNRSVNKVEEVTKITVTTMELRNSEEVRILE